MISFGRRRFGSQGTARGKRISEQMISCACDYAKENGFDYIEGYPSDGMFDARNCGGTDSMYKKRGFQIQYIGSRIIARKKLDNCLAKS